LRGGDARSVSAFPRKAKTLGTFARLL